MNAYYSYCYDSKTNLRPAVELITIPEVEKNANQPKICKCQEKICDILAFTTEKQCADDMFLSRFLVYQKSQTEDAFYIVTLAKMEHFTGETAGS